MGSLTTAYLVCMLIGSVTSIAGAYIGNKIYPIPSSVVIPPDVSSSAPPEVVQKIEPDPVVSPQNTVQSPPETVSAIV
jgi:hypothetical protein